jgi:hypothetical protein
MRLVVFQNNLVSGLIQTKQVGTFVIATVWSANSKVPTGTGRQPGVLSAARATGARKK